MNLSVSKFNCIRIFYFVLALYILFYSFAELPYVEVIYQNLKNPSRPQIYFFGIRYIFGIFWYVYLLYFIKIIGASLLFFSKTRSVSLFLILFTSILLMVFIVEGSPEQAFLNFMYMILLFKEFCKVNTLKNIKNLDWVVWFTFGLAYSISGCYKLMSPEWVSGDFMLHLTTYHVFNESFLFIQNYPKTLQFITYFSLLAEVLALPFCLFKKTRAIPFVSLSIFQIGALLILDLYQVSLGMIIFHIFIYLYFREDRSSQKQTKKSLGLSF